MWNHFFVMIDYCMMWHRLHWRIMSSQWDHKGIPSSISNLGVCTCVHTHIQIHVIMDVIWIVVTWSGLFTKKTLHCTCLLERHWSWRSDVFHSIDNGSFSAIQWCFRRHGCKRWVAPPWFAEVPTCTQQPVEAATVLPWVSIPGVILIMFYYGW